MPKTPPRDIKLGDIIAGRYEVRGSVGRGGMGRIYRVFDKILGEEVALKTLLPDHVDDKVVLDRFFNEARIARNLSHPNIVRVHDIGQADDTVYISMELLKGKSLRQMLDQLQPGQRLPIAGILRMFDALCAALDYAHHFTVHRDIKPENVMILTDGTLKLMDFGISKLKGNPNLTSASIVMGTPHYMAPEQLRNTSTVDARADVYSVGVMLYEVLTGDRPTGLAKPASKIHGEVPAALDPIIEKCCQADPSKRYQSAGELRAALREVRVDIERKSSAGESIKTMTGPARHKGSGLGRYAVAGVMLAAVGASAYGGLRWAEARRDRMLAAAPTGIATLPSTNAPQDDPAVREFARLAGRIGDLSARADATKREYSVEQQSGVVEPILLRGDELWQLAESQRGTDIASALELGWDAAACFIAIAEWPADMAFVPPAAAGRPRAAGFFVDVRPVTIGEFAAFCDAHRWEWPQQAAYREPADAPMTGAAYYDAVAYLAAASPPKRLASASELERAWSDAATTENVREYGVFFGSAETGNEESENPDALPSRVAGTVLEVPGDAYGFDTWREWTSSIENQLGAGAPTFGDDITTVAGRWTQTGGFLVVPGAPSRYEWSDETLGFRGKLDLPRTMAELDAIE